jgi:hypothetical protein
MRRAGIKTVISVGFRLSGCREGILEIMNCDKTLYFRVLKGTLFAWKEYRVSGMVSGV